MAFHSARGVDASGSVFTDVSGDQHTYNTTYHFAGPTLFSTPLQLDRYPSTKEPQNALTKLFTVAEWKALNELHDNLPGILSEAYPDLPNAQAKPINLWGVTIDPKAPKDARVSVLLMKFLRSRDMDVSKTREKLIKTLQWRERFAVERVVEEQFPEDVFGKIVHGMDKMGRPVAYIRYENFKAVISDPERLLRWLVALFERTMAMIDFENVDKMILVNDDQRLSLLSSLTAIANLKLYVETFNAYAELLMYHQVVAYEFIVYNPNWTSWVYNATSTLNSYIYDIKSKRIALGSEPRKIADGLLAIIDAKQLPKRYGGEASVAKVQSCQAFLNK